MINILFYHIKELVFPRKCMLCGSFLDRNELDLCHSCRINAPEYPFGASNPEPSRKKQMHFLDSFTAIWYYEDNVRNSIHRYKFRREYHLAEKYARLLAMKIDEQLENKIDLLTWVPISRKRKAERGFDQCQLLAKYVSRELEAKPVRLLRKIRNTPPQSGIRNSAERKANVLGAFQAVPGTDIHGKVILLLDDVFTTGATSEECARVLRTAGAKEVHCAAIAAVRHKK